MYSKIEYYSNDCSTSAKVKKTAAIKEKIISVKSQLIINSDDYIDKSTDPNTLK